MVGIQRDSGTAARGQWGSRLGFIFAAAGSAVGLGNIWKFPYATAEGGGGWFVLIYIACIAVVGLPVMMSELIIGREAQRSPVPAFEGLSGGKVMWSLVGWMGVVAGFIILSYYSIVAGWVLDYIKAALTGGLSDLTTEGSGALFNELFQNFGRNVLWHALFMAATVGIVVGGVQKGIERGATIMMPALFLMLIALVIYAATLDGFGAGMEFVFAPKADKIEPSSVLKALGQAFFSLSLGMGALITYGSYLSKKDDIVFASVAITGMDLVVALMAAMIMFPIVFSAGLPPAGDAGLAFITMPVAFSTIPGGTILAIVFFVLLLFAALTSAISLLEVVVATIIDKFGWTRKRASIVVGIAIFAFGIPSAKADLMIGSKNFFDWMVMISADIILPLGGLAIAVFVGWVMPQSKVYENFNAGKERGVAYRGWLFLVRFVVPVAILLVFLHAVGIIPKD
jgi:NSS family neurotransmitter:Na+ symporter